MSVQIPSIVAAAVFGLVLLSGTAGAASTDFNAWAKKAYTDSCMNGGVPADGIVRAEDIPTSDDA